MYVGTNMTRQMFDWNGHVEGSDNFKYIPPASRTPANLIIIENPSRTMQICVLPSYR